MFRKMKNRDFKINLSKKGRAWNLLLDLSQLSFLDVVAIREVAVVSHLWFTTWVVFCVLQETKSADWGWNL